MQNSKSSENNTLQYDELQSPITTKHMTNAEGISPSQEHESISLIDNNLSPINTFLSESLSDKDTEDKCISENTSSSLSETEVITQEEQIGVSFENVSSNSDSYLEDYNTLEQFSSDHETNGNNISNYYHCPICFESIGDENVTTTACNHKFHCACLIEHTSKNNAKCPICRTNILSTLNQEYTTSNNNYIGVTGYYSPTTYNYYGICGYSQSQSNRYSGISGNIYSSQIETNTNSYYGICGYSQSQSNSYSGISGNIYSSQIETNTNSYYGICGYSQSQSNSYLNTNGYSGASGIQHINGNTNSIQLKFDNIVKSYLESRTPDITNISITINPSGTTITNISMKSPEIVSDSSTNSVLTNNDTLTHGDESSHLLQIDSPSTMIVPLSEPQVNTQNSISIANINEESDSESDSELDTDTDPDNNTPVENVNRFNVKTHSCFYYLRTFMHYFRRT